MATERMMLDLLIQRYGKTDNYGVPRYQFMEHPATVYKGKLRTLDALALDRHATQFYMDSTTTGKAKASRVRLRHGFEVKCSRSDWLREIAQPDKAMAWSRYVHCFWLVVPDKALVKPGELPEGWGLLAPRGGKLFAQPTAKINPKPLAIDGSTLNNVIWAALKHDRRQNAWEDQTAPPEPQDLALNA